MQPKSATDRLVEEALKGELFPGLELLFARGSEVLLHRAYGRTSGQEDASALKTGHWFDLASLTKPLATAAAVLKLVEWGRVFLQQPVCWWFKAWDKGPKATITLADLLAHKSGLPAWAPLYRQPDDAAALQALLALDLEAQPRTKTIYSCLNFILLAQIVRLESGQPLATFCQEQLFQPWGISDLAFNPGPRPEVLESGHCPWRGRRLQGEVHDQNAARFGGDGGNAGLFGTARALHQIALNWLQPEDGGPLTAATLDLMRQNQNPEGLAPRGLGWDVYQPGYGYFSCGDLFSPGSFGHLGFTGTGLWADPSQGWVAVHLSHRVWQGDDHQLEAMRRFRAQLHNALIGDFS